MIGEVGKWDTKWAATLQGGEERRGPMAVRGEKDAGLARAGR